VEGWQQHSQVDVVVLQGRVAGAAWCQ
jgi:hypothetical protein